MRPAITFLNIQLSNSRETRFALPIFNDDGVIEKYNVFQAIMLIRHARDDNPSLTVEKQKNGCKASKINACSRFLFRNDMCYCAIFFTLW